MIALAAKRSLRLVLVTETFPPEVNGVARTLGRDEQAHPEGCTVPVGQVREEGRDRVGLQ